LQSTESQLVTKYKVKGA